MPREKLVNVRLTLAEATAVERIVNAAIADVRADPQSVSNEVTLQRAIESAERGLAKIREAIASVDLIDP